MKEEKEGYYKGKWSCLGGTVICNSKENCKKFEKEYYESIGEKYND